MNNENELLPCPFCGFEEPYKIPNDGKTLWKIICNQGYCSCGTRWWATLEEAVKSWNTRANDSRIKELEERLALAIDQLKNSGWQKCGCHGHWKEHSYSCEIGKTLIEIDNNAKPVSNNLELISLRSQLDVHAHEFKQLRNLLDCDGSDLEQLSVAITTLKSQLDKAREVLVEVNKDHYTSGRIQNLVNQTLYEINGGKEGK